MRIAALALFSVFLACTTDRPASTPPPLASDGITREAILEPIRVLASDAFEGRAPGTQGEERTVRYLTERFTALGLRPGNPDGTFVQRVPMIGFTPTPALSIAIGDRVVALRAPDDFVAASRRVSAHIALDANEMIFVGYGAVAPEYAWNDFEGVDVRGKTVVMLIGDPPVTRADDPSKLDDAVFEGRAMTYYGRWTYKFEIGAARGAAAVIIVHDTEGVGYPYEVVKSGWTKESLDIAQPGGPEPVLVQSWITGPKAREIFTAAGQDLDALKRAAAKRGFKAVPLGAKASFTVDTKLREMESRNLIAKVDGQGPHADEYVMYTAHWDHLGRAPSEGDGTHNGAIDNASGVATMLAIAGAFAKGPPPPRTILFLSPTGEETGLLGAKYYAAHPLYPLARTFADINMDCMNMWGRTRSIVSIGHGKSSLDDLLTLAAQTQGRTVRADPEPEKGYFFRSDHFELVKKGVPALHFLHPGEGYVNRPPSFGASMRAAYVAHDYHKVTDDVKADWDLEGAVDDARLLVDVGRRVAAIDARPTMRVTSH